MFYILQKTILKKLLILGSYTLTKNFRRYINVAVTSEVRIMLVLAMKIINSGRLLVPRCSQGLLRFVELIQLLKSSYRERRSRLFKIWRDAEVCYPNSLVRQSQRIQNAADVKELTSKTQETKGVELECVQSPLPLSNSKDLCSRNKTDHTQLNLLHCLWKVWSRKALLKL